MVRQGPAHDRAWVPDMFQRLISNNIASIVVLRSSRAMTLCESDPPDRGETPQSPSFVQYTSVL